jgi:DNA-binding response OmpR family regulator
VRVERDRPGQDRELGPLVRALAERGLALPVLKQGTDTPLLRAGGALIHWQAQDDPDARARAFEQGALEVIGPWMQEREMIARVLRFLTDPDRPQPRIIRGDLVIGLIDRSVERAGRPIDLLGREFALLVHLARRNGEPSSRMELLQAVWRLDFDPGTNSVEVHMSRLRAKVDRGFASAMLRTVKGRGYALCVDAGPITA